MYWPFHSISWHDHATQAPTDVRTGADGLVAWDVQTAWGKAKETYFYDNSPLQLPADYVDPGSAMGEVQQVDQHTAAQISKIVTAGGRAAFDARYQEIIDKVKGLGIGRLDAFINERVQKQMKDFGVQLRGINS